MHTQILTNVTHPLSQTVTNLEPQNNMCYVTRDLQTSPLLQTVIFYQTSSPLEREILYARPKTIILASAIQ